MLVVLVVVLVVWGEQGAVTVVGGGACQGECGG